MSKAIPPKRERLTNVVRRILGLENLRTDHVADTVSDEGDRGDAGLLGTTRDVGRDERL